MSEIKIEDLYTSSNSNNLVTSEMYIKKEPGTIEYNLCDSSIVALNLQEFTIKHEEIDIKLEEDHYSKTEDITTLFKEESRDESEIQIQKLKKQMSDCKTNIYLKSVDGETYHNNLKSANIWQTSRNGEHALTPDLAKTKMYHCDRCEYKTNCKTYLKTHFTKHQDPSELTVYECDRCEYKTCHKSYLKRHSVRHQDTSELTVYQCEKCGYKTKYKLALKAHFVVHQDPSKVIMYQCERCEFKTKYKNGLKNHLVIHQDSSKAIMYQCEKCQYKTKHKSCLKHHLVIHQDPSKVTMYGCEICEFKTRHKRNLRQHVLKLHNSLEVATTV